MRTRRPIAPEEPHLENYRRFVRLLGAVVTVSKRAIYRLEISLGQDRGKKPGKPSGQISNR